MLENVRINNGWTLWVCLIMLTSLASSAWCMDILFVSAMDIDTADSDAVLIGFLEGLGHDVNVLDDDIAEPETEAAAAAADLVVISESVNSARIKNEITDINTPMVITEMYAWDEMGLATDVVESPDCDSVNIHIVNADHPLAAGFSGTVAVFDQLVGPRGNTRMASAHAGPEATVVAQATLSDGGTYDVLFVYEKGAALPLAPADGSAQVAANIRVCIGFDEQSFQVWNNNALDLFEAAVNYALNIKPSPEAYVPKPANGAVDVPREVILGWRPGRFAETHDVYFGLDFNDVNEATLEDDRGVLVAADLTGRSVDVGTLDYGQTYFWRVDEANAAPDETLYRGHVWSFTIANYIVVEDFEAYDDVDPNRIFDTWTDGWFDPATNGAVVGYSNPDFDAGEHYVETDTIHSGKQSMPLFYDTDMKVAEANLPLGAAGFITDWTQDEVNDLSLWFQGFAGVVSHYVEEPGPKYRIVSIGADLYGASDECHFVYKEITGTTSIVAKIESIEAINDWVKAGVMIRDTLDGDARNVSAVLTPGNGVRIQYRQTVGGDTERAFEPNLPTPYWVKVERTGGGLVRGYISPNGSDWTRLIVTQVAMSGPIYVGLVATSHDPERTAEVVLSNVTMTGTGSDGPWMNQDIGLKTNSPESLYVVLNDAAVVYYEESDPNMPAAPTQNRTWRNWIIPLQDFADQGVDLTQVETLTLGVGMRGDLSSPGGSGQLYIDDIRLYRPPVE